MSVADLSDARQPRQIRVLEEAAEDRRIRQYLREMYEAQEETDPGFPEELDLGGGFTVERL